MVFNTNILAGSGGQDSGTAFSPVGLDFKNSAGSTNNYAHFVASVAATVSSPFSNKAPDGKKATLVMWYYPKLRLSENTYLFSLLAGTNPSSFSTPYSFFMRTDTPADSFLALWQKTGVESYNIVQVKSTFILNQWNCMLFSFNTSATDKSIRWYHNDADQGAGNPIDVNIGFNFGGASGAGRQMSVAGGFSQSPFCGAIAEVYYAPNQFIDFDIESNRRLFLNADGTPVDLGADGSTPTGSKPITYLSLREGEGAEQFGVNRGIGADLSVVGNVSIFADPVSCSIA
jgi:hypothetical protein